MILEGLATCPAVDNDGDVILPRGAIYSLPLPLLVDHRGPQVGEVIHAEVTDAGIVVRCRVDCSATRQRVYAGELGGMSVKFRVGAKERGRETVVKRWHWLELSLTDAPRNTECGASGVVVNGKVRRLGASYL